MRRDWEGFRRQQLPSGPWSGPGCPSLEQRSWKRGMAWKGHPHCTEQDKSRKVRSVPSPPALPEETVESLSIRSRSLSELDTCLWALAQDLCHTHEMNPCHLSLPSGTEPFLTPLPNLLLLPTVAHTILTHFSLGCPIPRSFPQTCHIHPPEQARKQLWEYLTPCKWLL